MNSLMSHTLNTMDNNLKVFFKPTANKPLEISLTVKDCVHLFFLEDVRINQQPAQHVKIFNAQIIKDYSLFRAEIMEGKLHLFSDSFASIKIQILHEEQYHSFQVSPSLTLSGLHIMIEEKLRVSDFTICDSKSKRPFGEVHTLEACGITELSSLMLIFEESPFIFPIDENTNGISQEGAFGLSKLLFVNFNNQKSVPLYLKAPEWRTVSRGLNLEGICKSKACVAYEKRVCDPKGISVFNMRETCTKAVCPMCLEKLSSVTNCIFWDCLYSIEGKTDKDEKTFKIENEKAPRETALSFAEATKGQLSTIVKWKFLTITTSPTTTFFDCVLL